MSTRTPAPVKAPEAKATKPEAQTRQSAASASPLSSYEQIAQLQRTVGNQAVQRMYRSGLLQAKLMIGQPNDIYEQEADRVSDQVMRMPAGAGPPCSKCASEKEKLNIHRKQDSSAPGSSVPDNFLSSLGSGHPLDRATRGYFEPRFGTEFSSVRVHSGPQAAESAASINALAYTSGSRVVFGAGQYQPDTFQGKRLLAHELTHVVQQESGSYTLQRKDTCSNSSSDEAKWAGRHEGKVFKTGDNPKEPNEAILWNFCVGETQLRENHQQSLKQEIPRWKGLLIGSSKSPASRSDLRINVRGAASSSGNKDNNEKIALERAQAVKTFLESEGIPGSFIMIEGVGSKFPLADETSPENMARNRRVELSLFTPTTTADITGALVAANVSAIRIGKQSAATPPPVFDRKGNAFSRVVFAMAASADVDLTGFAGDSVGFYQLLTGDQRIGLYFSETDGSELLLDYGRCNTILPCRDVLDATSLFSIDNRSLFLKNTGSASGTVRISDRPGTVFPMRYPDAVKGPFVLSRYFWKMDFDLILGIRSSGLFMPLQSAAWSLAASEDVDVKKQKTAGLSPVSVHQTFAPVTAADKKGELDKAFSGLTCRLMARSREIVPDENVCRPAEI